MLVSRKNAVNLVYTLIDFDFSMEKEDAISDKLLGTFGMFAPELLETLNRKPVEYSTRSDVFAIGVCVLNMFCGELVTGNRNYPPPLIGLTEHISGKRILEEGMTDERISCYVDENFGTTVFNARLFSPNERVPLPLVIEKLTTLLDADTR